MKISWRWTLFASFACGLASPALSQSVSPLPERLARLPDTDFRVWFSTMLGAEYRKGSDWQAFFGDVGPTEGCNALRDIKDLILKRDLAQFKTAYINAVSRSMAPTAFSNIPDNRLSLVFNSWIGRFEKDLTNFLGPRVLEMGEAGRKWAGSHGYHGRRLGYNDAGIPYWHDQPAMTTLICNSPGDVGLLRGWKN